MASDNSAWSVNWTTQGRRAAVVADMTLLEVESSPLVPNVLTRFQSTVETRQGRGFLSKCPLDMQWYFACDHVQFAKIVIDFPLVERHRDLTLHRVDFGKPRPSFPVLRKSANCIIAGTSRRAICTTPPSLSTLIHKSAHVFLLSRYRQLRGFWGG